MEKEYNRLLADWAVATVSRDRAAARRAARLVAAHPLDAVATELRLMGLPVSTEVATGIAFEAMTDGLWEAGL